MNHSLFKLGYHLSTCLLCLPQYLLQDTPYRLRAPRVPVRLFNNPALPLQPLPLHLLLFQLSIRPTIPLSQRTTQTRKSQRLYLPRNLTNIRHTQQVPIHTLQLVVTMSCEFEPLLFPAMVTVVSSEGDRFISAELSFTSDSLLEILVTAVIQQSYFHSQLNVFSNHGCHC